MRTHTGTPPLVSVVLPTRNRCRLLPHALHSVLSQEGRGHAFELEVVVVDDASSDETASVMRGFPEVQYIRLDLRRGAAAARNIGLTATTGPYVAFQDDDDLWLPQKVLRQLPALREYPEAAVVYSQNITRAGTRERLWPDSAPSGYVFEEFLMECYCAHPPSLLAPRGVFDRVGLFDEQLGSSVDYDMVLRLAFYFPFRFVPGAVAVYHASATGLWQTAMANGSGIADFRTAIEKALALLPDEGTHRRLKRRVRLQADLRIARDKAWAAGEDAQWAGILEVVRTRPEILRYRWGRLSVATAGCAAIVSSDDPMARGTSLAYDLGALTRAGANWYAVRLTLGALWAEVALALQNRPHVSRRAAGVAALRAVCHNPIKLRHGTIRRAVVRGLTVGDKALQRRGD